MTNKLPVSRVVSVSVNLTPAGAQSQSLSDLLILGTSTIIDPVERSRTYSAIADVATDFGTNAEEYKAALAWFSQSPQPTRVVVGRWAKVDSKGGLRCGPLSAAQQAMAVWNAIVAGKFGIAVDGGAVAQIGPLNFGAAANLPAVAAIIDGAVTANATCVWNATYSRFEFTSKTTGAASAISFLTAPLAGADMTPAIAGLVGSSGAYVFAGMVAETAAAAVALFDDVQGQRWYGLNIPAAANADHLAVAAYVEAATNKHVYGVTSQEAASISSVVNTDIGYQLKAFKYKRTMVQYSSSSANAVVSALARILTVNYEAANTTLTLKFKNEPGVVAEDLSTTQANAAEAKNVNIFVDFDNNTSILEQGVMVDGTFVDVVLGTDWLAITIQRDIYNLLYTSTTKIPQTDQGMQILTTAVEARCAQGVRNGLLAPGVWSATGFGQLAQNDFLSKGYYVYAQPVSLQASADRTARMATPIQVAAKLAGAIHTANVAITVNQ